MTSRNKNKTGRRGGMNRQDAVAEGLEARVLLAADLKFAVMGDYSTDEQTVPESQVSALIHGWNPAFIATVGDNNYPDGAASTIDPNIGQYYHDYIYPYKGSYGTGSPTGTNRFWPTLGNHDWNTGTDAPYLNYFTLPGNGRYYTLTQGNVELFMVDADPHEPDGVTSTSVQGQWLKGQLASSTAQWKLVLFHQPAYSSGDHGDNVYMQWPFAQWGASAVISGHDHDYERLFENGIPYFVDGLGGESLDPFTTVDAGSQVRYVANYGAMLLDASATSLNFQFINVNGTVIDSYTLGAPSAPAAPSALKSVAAGSSGINLSWTNNSTSAGTSFDVERSTNGQTFTQIAVTAVGATTFNDSGLSASTSYYYRVRAVNTAGQSGYSNVASVATNSTAPITYLSDLQAASATTGYGTIGRDVNVDGTLITLHGVSYTKGIGTHAVSQIVYNLAGGYSNFICDVGVDDDVASVGSVDFKVLGDGAVLFDSGVLTNSSPTVSFNLNVAGVKQLTLIATNGVAGTIDYDHADWAGARLSSVPSTPAPPAAPSGLSASAPTPTQVLLSWTDNAVGNETGFVIQRSSDNQTFTQLATVAAGMTSYTDTATLSAGQTYYYRVAATNAQGASAFSAVASALIPSSTTVTTYLSDLTWTSASIGWGSVTKDKSVGGNTLTLRGMTYAKGIGTHALSQIVYSLNGQYASFMSDVGVDDEENAKGTGSVDFQVIGDGVVLFDSGVLTNKSAVVHINVNVAGVKQLTLLATNGVSGSIDYDHADWAGARVSSQPSTQTAPTAPTDLVATANSASQISLTWTDTSSSQTAIQIDRSTDNVTFTPLSAIIAGTTTSYVDTDLTAATTYYYRVRALNSVGASPNSAVASAKTLTAGAVAPAYLSDLTPTSATTGYGSIQKDKSVNGNAITLRGTKYAKGIGTHAVSNISFALKGQYSTFTSDVGVDDEIIAEGGTGSIDFQVLGDNGKVLFDSGILTGKSAVVHINISIVGVQNLTLVATNGVSGSIDYDHADWAGAMVS